MRAIDRRVGVPICLLLSAVEGIKGILAGAKRGAPPSRPRILFLELSEMGSMVLARPTFERAKEMFPDGELFFLTFLQNRVCIDVLDVIPRENVLTIRNDTLLTFVGDLLTVFRKLRRLRIEIVVDLELFSRFTSILSYLCGASQRVGFHGHYSEGLYRGNFQTHKVSYNPYQHMSLNFLSLLEALRRPAGEFPLPKTCLRDVTLEVPRFRPDKPLEEAVWRRLKNVNAHVEGRKSLVVFNPNAGSLLPIRAWPRDNYVELGRRLLQEEGLFIVIIGLEEAVPDAETICESLRNPRCMNLTQDFTLEEVITLFSVSDVLVTNDSGPAQFAALSPIDIVVLFGPETPELYTPLSMRCRPVYARLACSPCLSAFNHRTTSCGDNRCLQVITVDEVYEAVMASLTHSTGAVGPGVRLVEGSEVTLRRCE